MAGSRESRSVWKLAHDFLDDCSGIDAAQVLRNALRTRFRQVQGLDVVTSEDMHQYAGTPTGHARDARHPAECRCCKSVRSCSSAHLLEQRGIAKDIDDAVGVAGIERNGRQPAVLPLRQ